uniref:Syntaxin 17 n=1 Tax=Oncorhynchus mykiss TaxID=8022 RepID=A0A8C7QCA0_ONCMY
MSEEGGNLTLRRLEGPIHKFTKVALPTDLERLQRHHSNILKFQHSGQWDRLHQEHINASRTVQQLRSNVREMEKLCGRVRPEDSPALERLVQPIRDRASAATQDFLLLHSNPAPLPQDIQRLVPMPLLCCLGCVVFIKDLSVLCSVYRSLNPD